MLGKIELFGYFLLDGVVFKVAIKFRKVPKVITSNVFQTGGMSGSEYFL